MCIRDSIEDQVVEKGIEIFKKSIALEPLKELQSKDWIDRTSFPIGMNQEGVFFLDMKQKKESNPSSEEVQKEPVQKIDKISKPINNPKTKEPKEKKKGFWSKLFGK